jgi:hypothetical protein
LLSGFSFKTIFLITIPWFYDFCLIKEGYLFMAIFSEQYSCVAIPSNLILSYCQFHVS